MLDQVSVLRENCSDIYAEAKQINEDRAAAESEKETEEEAQMKIQIKHEIRSRLRVHLPMNRMSFAEADTLDHYLQGFAEIKEVCIYERTADAGIAISEGAEIARQIADITISGGDLESIVILRELAVLLMKRIRFNYRTIVGFNTALIALGIAGIMPPATSAMLHNGSTVALGLKSLTDLMPGL